jgi:NCK-associated protein 1
LADKNLESAVRHILKRFPNTDTRNFNSQLGPVFNMRQDIVKMLHLYYYTFLDVLEFRDHVCELLTTMDACQLRLDITINFDLTKGYLDLIATYVSLLILLSRVEDRKAIIGLFNTAHEMVHGASEPGFPRLGQMIIDYDTPMKKLSEEFVPHSKLLLPALCSIHHFFIMRNLPTDEWRKSQILSLVGNPAHLLTPTITDSIQCEYLSNDSMEKYIVFGFMLLHQSLGEQIAHDLFFKALQYGWVMTLYRDEVISTHNFVQTFFESIKGYGKRVNDVKESYTWAIQNAGHVHLERRKFLRTALKELGLIFADQPGLLGPKVLLIFIGLSFARDEVNWLLRHNDNIPTRQGRSKAQSEDLVDRQLPELLFHIEELRALVRKYNQVIQRYYVQYLTGYDAAALHQQMRALSMLPEDDCIILESVYQMVSNLSVKQVENNEMFDFRGLRLDWYRLQAYTSVARYPMYLLEHKEIAHLLNSIVFHTKVVDYLDELLTETSNLSQFCFYNKTFENQFHMCLEFPAQTRYIIAFPLICSHFMACSHELCPEERHMLGERSLTMLNIFLDEMAKEAKNIITTVCDKQCLLSDQLLAKNAAPKIAFVLQKKKRDKKSKQPLPTEFDRPGTESYRRSREDLTTMDKLHMALTELCYAINYCPSIHIWEHTFAPREYLLQHLETRFSKSLVGMAMFNTESQLIAKPSELLDSVKTYMNVLQSIENYVHIDITRVFNDCLLQQTQPQDSHGDKTITALYTNWYLEVLLRRVSTGQIVYSPVQKAFVTLPNDQPVPFLAEEFSDVNELQSLAELIGPYGIKYLNESLMWHIASQVSELKKLVIGNKEILVALRSNYDKPEQMRELFKRLQSK